ncbi:FtsQ-type POTRA domain-containing protein [Nocardia sp. SYP-A9097]|uniref:cell division protein FtsQ/DivIB n=1 Tax=Nocardia sp. SYP-A9097 TaxID=2663237 RepID=UPI00129AC7EF|nr:FtsQ-type POTRA domain-containing protein [Nocardia sp. SYP-A9097]MRH92538.1 FtsQ-type POTRA domain-containing protein [Nocardia sp. SYP-A9097]
MSSGGGADDSADGAEGSDDRPDETVAERDSAAKAAARRARLRRGRGREESRLLLALRSGRVRIGIAVGVVLLLALGLAAWFTPVLSVRTVRVDGLAVVPEDQVLDALQVPDGLSMMRIDTTAMAERVAQLPKVRSVRVRREFPSTVQVTVVERTPVLYYDAEDGPHLLDCDGVEFAIEPPPGTAPKLVTDHPGGTDPVTRAAVTVMAVVPPSLGVGEVVARSVSDIALELRDGRTVLWGGTGDSQKKAAVVGPLLTQPGKVFDVSSPNLVTVK